MVISWLKARIAKRVVTEVRDTFGLHTIVNHLKDHYASLFELFKLECQEYLKHQMLRVGLLLAGALFMVLAYVGFWAALVTLLMLWLAPWAAVGICFLFHLLVGLAFIIFSIRMKSKSFAPATREELQHDITCARLSLGKKGN